MHLLFTLTVPFKHTTVPSVPVQVSLLHRLPLSKKQIFISRIHSCPKCSNLHTDTNSCCIENGTTFTCITTIGIYTNFTVVATTRKTTIKIWFITFVNIWTKERSNYTSYLDCKEKLTNTCLIVKSIPRCTITCI
jgi:hypothetical protein